MTTETAMENTAQKTTAPCKYHPDRQTDRRLVSWVRTSSMHAYPIDHGPQCEACIDEAFKKGACFGYRFLGEPMPQAY